MMKIVTIVGARPQIIKAAALSRAIGQCFASDLNEIIVHTGQHYDDNMSGVFFRELGIPEPCVNLSVGSSAHGDQTARMISGIEQILLSEKPDAIVLYGDTNSTLAGAVAASKIHIPVVHIESGLRSFNKRMPEEINRIVADHCATMLFCPTKTAVKNLENEGFISGLSGPYSINKPGIFHCGDIMYDNSLHFSTMAEQQSNITDQLNIADKPYILGTIHRNDNTDDRQRLTIIISALEEIAKKSKLPLILPLHPRTRKMMMEWGIEPGDNQLIHLVPPASFLDMIKLEKHSSLIITDSGGVQKEAYFFGKPSLILRPQTEWVEIVDVKAARLGGSTTDDIVSQALHFIETPPDSFPPLFGDGHAAEFICETMLQHGSF